MAKIKTKPKSVAKRRQTSPPVFVTVLSSGKSSEFWAIVCAAIDENITECQNELLGPTLLEFQPLEYKIRSEILKEKIRYLEFLKGTPDTLIKAIAEEKEPEESHDPYE